MILVDSSIWIDHLRNVDQTLSDLLAQERVLVHPFVIGEIALGHLRQRDEILGRMSLLPLSTAATDDEVLHLIAEFRLFGIGLGYVDTHLLASTMLTARGRFWSRDKRLRAAAERLGVAANLP